VWCGELKTEEIPKILQPVMNYLLPYSQHVQQLSPHVVIPLVLEVVATCLVIPDMKVTVFSPFSCFSFSHLASFSTAGNSPSCTWRCQIDMKKLNSIAFEYILVDKI
jgi:hypothetical protein